MKIEILLASYNGERYIEEQLRSILDQDYERFHILISDDGSTDKTVEIIENFKERYPERIFISEKKKNACGAGENFFDLLECSGADYLMFADQDDFWEKDKIKKTARRMRAMESKYGREMPILIHSDLKLANQKLQLMHPSMHKNMHMRPHCKDIRHLLVENNITGSTVMINAAMRKIFLRPKNYVLHDWWLGLLAAFLGKISYIDESLVIYRQHESNVMGAKNAYTLKAFWKRLFREEKVRENYRKIFAQAGELLQLHGGELPSDKKEILQTFIKLEKMSRKDKIKSIIKNRFFKSGILMTFGEMLNI